MATTKTESKAKTFPVVIGRFGSTPETVQVKVGSTIAQVLKTANIEMTKSEDVWLNGAPAKGTTKVKKGDIVGIVSPREAGN